MFIPWAEVELDDATYCLSLTSPFAPFRFAEHAPTRDFWATALSLEQLSRSDLRALLCTACDESADEIDRLMRPENRDQVLAALKEAVEIAVDALETSRYVN